MHALRGGASVLIRIPPVPKNPVTSPPSPGTQSVRYTRRRSACASVSVHEAAGARTELSESLVSEFFSWCQSATVRASSSLLFLSIPPPFFIRSGSAGLIRISRLPAVSDLYHRFRTEPARDRANSDARARVASPTSKRLRGGDGEEEGPVLLTHVLLTV